MIKIQDRLRREYNRCYKAILRWQWRRAGMEAPIVLMVHGFVPSREDCISAFHLTAASFERLLTYLINSGWHAMSYAEMRKMALAFTHHSPLTSSAASSNLSPLTSSVASSNHSPLTSSAASSNLSPQTSSAASSHLSPLTSSAASSNLKQFHLTFDDVYDTVYTEALPILEKLQIPFTVFLTKDLIGKVDSADGIHPMITSEHLAELVKSPLCTIGCHGLNHLHMRFYEERIVKAQALGSKAWVMQQFGVEPDCFAFPFGRWQDVNKENIRELAQCGYSLGFSAVEGTLLSAHFTGQYFLPRVNVSETFVEKFVNHQPLKWKDCEGR